MNISLEHLENGYYLHFEGIKTYSLYVSSEDMASFMVDEEIISVEDVDPSELASTYNEYESIVAFVNPAAKMAA
jgi:hypothetical protein